MEDLITSDPILAVAKLRFLKPIVDNYNRVVRESDADADADTYREVYERSAGEKIEHFEESLVAAIERAELILS